MSLMEPGPYRDRIKETFLILLSYISQLALTLVLFFAMLPALLRLYLTRHRLQSIVGSCRTIPWISEATAFA